MPFGNFPDGLCQVTTRLFAKHMQEEHGAKNLIHIDATRETDQPNQLQHHGWLLVDTYLVDLTADQYEEVDEKVIVEPMENSEWHRSFCICRQDLIEKAIEDCWDMYPCLQTQLDKV